MNLRHLGATCAGLALLSVAGAANAAITVSLTEANNLYGPLSNGQVMLYDFDGIDHINVDYSGNEVTDTPNPITNSAPPPLPQAQGGVPVDSGGSTIYVDPTDYASVQGGTTGTFSALNGFYFTSFSFYMGSPDTYNQVTFNFLGGGSQVFTGDDIWGGTPAGTGDRTQGLRVYYDFDGAKVASITFSSSQDAFEFDGLGGTIAVPEPGTWALMILGFGGAGAMLRSNRRRFATVAAA